MVQFDAKSCTPKLRNCASSPLGDQPFGLTNSSNKWVCPDCFEGFFWNDEENICDECNIDHCFDCLSETECNQCITGYMPGQNNIGC